MAAPAMPPLGAGARDQAAGDLGDLEGGQQRGQQRQDVADRPQDESSDIAGARRGRVLEVGEDLFDVGGILDDVAHGHDELHHDAEDRGRDGGIQAVGDEHAEPGPEQEAQRSEDEKGDEERPNSVRMEMAIWAKRM